MKNMKNLLIKEWKLAIHPTVFVFWALSAMLLIPNYPYEVIFFYTALGLFFVCLTGRENNDLDYTMLLPVRKKDAVRARILFAVTVELILLLCMAVMAVLRALLGGTANLAGMDANLSLFGSGLILLGLYNWLFFPRYYRNPRKVGKAFAISSILFFVFVAAAEVIVFAVPLFRDVLDTPDPQFLTEKLLYLAVGLMAFLGLTAYACRRSEKLLEALDL